MASSFNDQMVAIFGEGYKLFQVNTKLKAAGATISSYSTARKSVSYKFSDGTILEVFK
jgi:hypothetical protein